MMIAPPAMVEIALAIWLPPCCGWRSGRRRRMELSLTACPVPWMSWGGETAVEEKAAQWFHEKWNVPVDAYLESIEESLNSENPVPQWYLAVKEGRIWAWPHW